MNKRERERVVAARGGNLFSIKCRDVSLDKLFLTDSKNQTKKQKTLNRLNSKDLTHGAPTWPACHRQPHTHTHQWAPECCLYHFHCGLVGVTSYLLIPVNNCITSTKPWPTVSIECQFPRGALNAARWTLKSATFFPGGGVEVAERNGKTEVMCEAR